MHSIPPSRRPPANGFTLLEVLGALALCVMLAGVAATASVHSSRALRRAEALRDQTLRLRTLYAQAHCRPDETENVPAPWRIDRDELLVPPPAPPRPASRVAARPPLPPRRWTLLTLRDTASALRPVQLAILETSP